jgi:hypothetical protein
MVEGQHWRRCRRADRAPYLRVHAGRSVAVTLPAYNPTRLSPKSAFEICHGLLARRLPTLHRRYERKAEHFLAFVGIAAALISYRRLTK